jgi:hypothetical protein
MATVTSGAEDVRQAYLDGLHAGWDLGIAVFGLTFLWALVLKWPRRLTPAKGPKDTSCATVII